jgi:MFS family permease
MERNHQPLEKHPDQGIQAWLNRTVKALRSRNYRLFFLGQIVSLCGTWMTNMATGWLVYRLTGSALMLGLVTCAGQIPMFVLGPFSGILVDRVNKRRTLVLIQSLSMIQSFALAAMTLSGHTSIAGLIILNLINGIITAFDIPMRQSFVIEMIEDKAALGNAIALNSTMFNAARFIGPAIGALVIAAYGEGWCFFIDGCSFLAVIAAFLAMRIQPSGIARPLRGNVLPDLMEGWRMVSRRGPIRRIITLLALTSLLGTPYATLVPLFAGSILKGGPHTLGLLMSSAGAGALVGAGWLAGRRSVLGLGAVIPTAVAVFGIGVIGFALSRQIWLSMLFLFIGGGGLMIQMASSNTILQTIVDNNQRGRIMSFYMMAFMGTAPIGSLMAGWISERFGAPLTLVIGGAVCMGGAARFFLGLEQLREAIRPIYRRIGILPEIESGEEAASQLAFEARD